jgi:hypothetical protein
MLAVVLFRGHECNQKADVTNSEDAIVPQEVFHSFATSASSLMAASTAMPKVMIAIAGGGGVITIFGGASR